jgi:hypothetical protein
MSGHKKKSIVSSDPRIEKVSEKTVTKQEELVSNQKDDPTTSSKQGEKDFTRSVHHSWMAGTDYFVLNVKWLIISEDHSDSIPSYFRKETPQVIEFTEDICLRQNAVSSDLIKELKLQSRLAAVVDEYEVFRFLHNGSKAAISPTVRLTDISTPMYQNVPLLCNGIGMIDRSAT